MALVLYLVGTFLSMLILMHGWLYSTKETHALINLTKGEVVGLILMAIVPVFNYVLPMIFLGVWYVDYLQPKLKQPFFKEKK